MGLATGVPIGYHLYGRYATNGALQRLRASVESIDRLSGARGVRAIELVQSGSPQQAIQLFSIPIADFYSEYAHLPHNDQKTKKLLFWIEQTASTNAAIDNFVNRERAH